MDVTSSKIRSYSDIESVDAGSFAVQRRRPGKVSGRDGTL
jgi:hypothetical protein